MTKEKDAIDEFKTVGFDAKGASKNRSTLYSTAGIEWPKNARMEIQPPRYTDYPFSVDISNNRILVSLDRNGSIRRGVVATGVKDVRGETGAGIYVSKQLAVFEGGIGLHFWVDQVYLSAPSLSFLQGVIPVYRYHSDGLTIVRRIFAPQHRNERPLKIIQLITVINKSDKCKSLRIEKEDYRQTIESGDSLIHRAYFIQAESENVDDSCTGMKLNLEPSTSQELALVTDFSPQELPLVCTVPGLDDIHLSLSETLDARKTALGRLYVDGDQWWGEETIRLQELARQSLLLLPDGKAAGTFSGSNAIFEGDVWFRDMSYTTLSYIESNPDLAAACINLMAVYCLPNTSWGQEARQHPDWSGFAHSVGNACFPVILASLLLRRYGSKIQQFLEPAFFEYIRLLARDLTEERPASGALYRTLYISDGPARGDFHTGSNILAWRALKSLTEDFASCFPEICVLEMSDIMRNLRAAIDAHCVVSISGHQMFAEGVYQDGTAVGVHDGEESDLVLAPVYGFAKLDDERISAHVSWAFGQENPFYWDLTDAIDFWDFDDSNGITFPGYLTRLGGANTRSELDKSLSVIKRLADLDGSFWWWPFEHDVHNTSDVRRSLGKCGWGAGEFISLLVHRILGLSLDQGAGKVQIEPYSSWSSWQLDRLVFNGGYLNISVSDGSIRLTNLSATALKVIMQVPIPPGGKLENVVVNGETRRSQARVVHFHDGSAVRCEERVDAKATVELTCSIHID